MIPLLSRRKLCGGGVKCASSLLIRPFTRIPRYSHSVAYKRFLHEKLVNNTGCSGEKNAKASLSTVSSSARENPSEKQPSSHNFFLGYTVRLFDKFGIPVTSPENDLSSLEALESLAPSTRLREQLNRFFCTHHWKTPSPVQKTVIPIALQGLDVLCIAPTALGKTFAFVLVSILKVIELEMAHGSLYPHTSITGSSVEELVQKKIQKGEICKYCELNMAEHKVCLITGTLHPEPKESFEEKRERKRLEDLQGCAMPRVLVLVPTSTLVHQVHSIYMQLRENLAVRYLVRASSGEEQKKFLNALEGADILISTPETLIPALLKKKLDLSKVQVIIADEIDEIVSNNHFESLKLILSKLPKGQKRPQHLFFGASLPPVAYQMLRDRLLESTHIFVLIEKGKALINERRNGVILTSTNSIKHIVLVVSQAEKIRKLLWLYQTEKVNADQSTIIFCSSRHNVAYVADRLRSRMPELHVTTLSSQASDTAKVGTLKLFRSGASTCLVCTDLLSRGMHFPHVVNLIHYDMPLDISTWMHRSGRCGRDGNLGFSFTFFQPENIKLAKPLVAYLKENKQLVPPKLQEYARQSFVDVFNSSLLHHPTKRYRAGDPLNHTPVLGRGTSRYPDYRQDQLSRHRRPH